MSLWEGFFNSEHNSHLLYVFFNNNLEINSQKIKGLIQLQTNGIKCVVGPSETKCENIPRERISSLLKTIPNGIGI